MQFTHVGPQFVVRDVNASIDFYKNVLGFKVDYKNGSPVAYAVVYRDEVYIHLCLQETQKFKIGPGCCFICVSNVDKLWDKVQSSRVEIIQSLKKYGNEVLIKGFTINDLDKNVLRIGQLMNANS